MTHDLLDQVDYCQQLHSPCWATSRERNDEIDLSMNMRDQERPQESRK